VNHYETARLAHMVLRMVRHTCPVSASVRHWIGHNMRNSDRRDKRRGARQRHKRLLYCVNVNRTSLDHLLLGRNADVDKSVE
jgi:hypothetical protein